LPSRYPFVVQDALRHCQPKHGLWVDLGAGQGQVSLPLIEATGNPVLMLDPDAEAMWKGLETAREKGLADRLSCVVGVAEDMPLPDNSVDFIASRGSIFFWDDPVKGLQEIYRVLRPGGKAYVGGGAGSGYPAEAVNKLIDDRKKKMEGDEAEKWKRFVELRRPERMREWAEDAGLADFTVMGRGAISAEDERVGQGVWLLFEKKATPYPPSSVIKSLTVHPQRTSIGDGDNWPITWADDEHQYTVYCDGEGFGGGSGKGSMSLARILGSPPGFRGENLASPTGHKEGGGPKGRKASGLLMADGVLYMWVRNLKQDGTGSSLAWSEDRAATWTWAEWSFPEIGYPTWLNAGQDYAAAQDEYAYLYSPDTPSAYKTSDHMILARVPVSGIRDESGYRFFAGLNGDGQPKWTAEFKERKSVFTDPGHCYRPEVVLNPGIGKYLLLTATSGAPRWCGTDEKYLGIFEAAAPWGPWRTVKRINGWGGEENRFQPRIPPKWISEDGKTFYLLYSCFPEGPYQFNVQECSFETTEPRPK
jgi:SAM-dependent methyltransferase